MSAAIVIPAVLDTIAWLEKYGPLLIKAKRGRDLVKEALAFVREHRNVKGLSAEQRDRARRVLALDPEDVSL